MSTHNIQFHDRKENFLKYLFSGVVGRISLGLENEFELAMVNESSAFELLRFAYIMKDILHDTQKEGERRDNQWQHRNRITTVKIIIIIIIIIIIQYNLNGSNPYGSFTVDDSNSFFSPYEILPIAQENKYLGIFSYFIMELYVVCTH